MVQNCRNEWKKRMRRKTCLLSPASQLSSVSSTLLEKKVKFEAVMDLEEYTSCHTLECSGRQ